MAWGVAFTETDRDKVSLIFAIIHALLIIYTLYCLYKINKSRKHYTKLIFILGIIINYALYKQCVYTGYTGSFLELATEGFFYGIGPVVLIYLSTIFNYFTYREHGNTQQD